MKIKIRLTLIFSLVFGLILYFFMWGVYQFYSSKSHSDYFERLHLVAALKVDLIDGEAVDPAIFHLLYENASSKYEPHVTIYTDKGRLIYHDKARVFSVKEVNRIFHAIVSKGECKLWHGDIQTYGFLIEGKKGNYAVYASGYDYVGFSQLETLRKALIIAYLIAVCCVVVLLWFFIKQTLYPVAQMMEKVENITGTNQLDIRLNEGNKKDELAQLAVTFNRMLAQLEKSFESQKQFVYNISHELRTPLATIITELELSRSSKQTEPEYREIIENVLSDARRLSKLSTNLLDLARANYSSTEIGMADLRVDELLLEVCAAEKNTQPDHNVHISFDDDLPEDERCITVQGNEYLLRVAFGNLINNACKFSHDKSCAVRISCNRKRILVRISDTGIGIDREEWAKVYDPFFRGKNHYFAEGNGIGLSLTSKIINLHNGTIEFTSRPGETVFSISLNNIVQESSFSN